jgi:hypothetical protein
MDRTILTSFCIRRSLLLVNKRFALIALVVAGLFCFLATENGLILSAFIGLKSCQYAAPLNSPAKIMSP